MLRVCVNTGLDALVLGLWWRFFDTRTGGTEDVPAEARSRETKNLLLMPSEGKERMRVMTPPPLKALVEKSDEKEVRGKSGLELAKILR